MDGYDWDLKAASQNKSFVKIQSDGSLTLEIAGFTFKKVTEDDCDEVFDYYDYDEDDSRTWIAWLVAALIVCCTCSVLFHCCWRKQRRSMTNEN